MPKTDYAWEKFHIAVDSLALMDKDLYYRIYSAVFALHTLGGDDNSMPDSMQTEFNEFWDKVTRVQSEELGSMLATAKAMSDDELQEVGKQILSFYEELVRMMAAEGTMGND